jgi:chromosome segregation ATPase
MIKTTLNSSDSSPTPEPGAIDSLWQPSWLQWLVAALSGTVETEKQIAWLKKSTAELKKSNAELRKYNAEWIRNEQKKLEELKKSNARLKKSNAELKKSNVEWLSNEQRTIEELRQENDRLAEIESKLDAILHRSNTNLTPAKLTDKP